MSALTHAALSYCSSLCVIVVAALFTIAGGDDAYIEQCANLTIPGCTCADLGSAIGITCDSQTDIPNLAKSLDSIFGNLTEKEYEVTLAHFTHVPAGVVPGLRVFRFNVDGPEAMEISKLSFDGVEYLKRFRVLVSNLSGIPNFTSVAHSIERINIDNSLLKEVKFEFQNLPKLERLSLRNNTIELIQADSFNGSINIQYLDLSNNFIFYLPENLLDELKDLLWLSLSTNMLYTVEGLLKNIGSKMKFLNLEFNNLNDSDKILHPLMANLISLSLNSNPLRTLSSRTFNHVVPNVRFLYLDHCNLSEFRVDHFNKLFYLSTLDLSFNQIRHIGNDSLDFGNNFDLILSGNKMEDFRGGITYKTKRLFFTDNSFVRLGEMLRNTQLAEVDVSRNRLIALETVDFTSSFGTENLAFRDNEIERIDVRCFDTFRNEIHTLDLSGNKLTDLNRGVQYLSQLKALNVSNNFLETLDDNEFVGLNELSELYIQNNRIVVLRGQIQMIPSLQYLILQNNTISHLDIKQIPRTLRYLYINGNPLNCNCKLYLQFLTKLKNTPELDSMPCTPTNAPEDEFQLCPSPCSCKCKSDVNASFVSVDCSSRQLTFVPSAFSNWSIFSSPPDGEYRIDDPNFAIYDRTLALNLSNNTISSLKGVHLSPNLKELFLAKNRLSTLPYSIMNISKLREVTLSKNPWNCDCDDGKAVEFRKWLLSKNQFVLDANQTRCYQSNDNKDLEGKVIVSVAEADLCPSEIGIIITLTFSVLCLLLLVAAIKITFTRYEINIKVWLYSKGVTFVKEKDIDRDKRFDAFLSFSHADQDFVTEAIIDELEERCPNINLCIHYRHFVPGKFIHENIMDAVNNSKRTVLILNTNFLESEWCMMEFRAADAQNIKDKVRRVVVIKVGDLPSDMDPSIQVYMKSTTYLTWGEKYFWQKFIYALPRPSPYPPTTQSSMTLLS